jgi:hypothetical protein
MNMLLLHLRCWCSWCIIICCSFFAIDPLQAQSDRPRPEQLLIETYWQYAYTLHLETGTVVHQADDNSDLVVVFHYDSVFQLYNHGLMLDGRWTCDNGQLRFPFKQVDSYRLTAATNQYLELSFNPPNSAGTFLYHFTAIERPIAMFPRREGELPEVLIEERAAKKSGIALRSAKRKERKSIFWWRNEIVEPIRTPIQVEITGGGYYGGVDPVLRDHIVIKSDGRLVQEFMTKNRGLTVTKKDIPREELELFVNWLEDQQFFDMERQYDCTSRMCDKRKDITPKPTPLRVCITYGIKRKMVTVTIWGKDKNGERYVEYPPQIDNIVDAVQRMANRI